MTKFRVGIVLGVSLLVVMAGSFLAYARDDGKLSGDWFIYAGTLDDRALPTATDAKVWMQISGPLAAQMYQRLGQSAQLKDTCGEPDLTTRRRGEIDCTLQKGEEAVCHVNFDLRTGKVWGGTIC